MKRLTSQIIFIIFVFFNLLPILVKAQELSHKEKLLLKESIRLISIHNYNDAIPFLKTIYKSVKNNANVNYLLGKALLKTNHIRDAIFFLKSAKDKISSSYKEFSPSEIKAPVETLMLLGEAYHKAYNFDKAEEMYKDYLKYEENPDTTYINRQIKSIKYARKAVKDTIKISITNLGSNVNSKYNDYAPAIDSSQTVLIFTSRRNGNLGEKTDYGDFPSDLYISYFKNGKWTKSKSIGKEINTIYDEASISLAAGAKHLFIFMNRDGNGDIYESFFVDSAWTKPQKLPKWINTKYNEIHASITADESELYFVSDRPGGYGGKDIYYCVSLPNGEWSKPKNLGPIINTKFDEDAVFVHPDGKTLYFSSKGHDNFGGYDIFYTNRKSDGTWSKPKNFGFPINTPNNENFFVITPDNKAAYFSALRSDSYGGRDIYKMDFLSLPGRYETVVKGFVFKNGIVAKDIILNIYDEKGKFVGKYKPNKKGVFFIILKQNSTYKVVANVNGKEYENKMVIPDKTSYFLTGKIYEVAVLLTID